MIPDASPALRRVCAAQRSRAARMVAAADARCRARAMALDASAEDLCLAPDGALARDLADYGVCHPSPRGAWMVLLEHYRFNPAAHDVSEERFSGSARVAYVTTDGDIWTGASAPVPLSVGLYATWNEVIVQTVDLDGDGVAEALVHPSGGCNECDPAGPETGYQVLTARAGAVVAYPGTENLWITEVVDPDHDGRPDLRVAGTFRLSLPDWGLSGIELGDQGYLLHALVDGRYVAGDPVGVRDLLSHCHRPPTRYLDGASEDLNVLMDHVACARYWQVSGDEVDRHLQPLVRARDELHGQTAQVRAMAHQEPPVPVRFRCVDGPGQSATSATGDAGAAAGAGAGDGSLAR